MELGRVVRLSAWLGLLVGPLAQATAHAQVERFTLERAEQVAIARAPAIRSAEAQRATAEAHRTFGEMPRVGNPIVSMRALVGKPDDPAATYSLMVGLPFDVSGQRPAWRREASLLASEAEARLIATRNDVRAEVREAYADVALSEAARRVAEQAAATAGELFERTKARVSASAATALDLTLSESQYAESQANLVGAQRALVEAQDRFRRVLDLQPTVTVEVEPLGVPALPTLSLEEATARALAARKELSAWAHARDRHRASDRRLRAEAVAPVTAGFDAEHQGNKSPNRSVGASVGFELPIALRNQGERAVARGEASAAEVERELTEHAITREVAVSLQRLERALEELRMLDERALPAAERTLTMVQALLDSGAVDYFRLLGAREQAFSLRGRRVAVLREAWSCRVALERALGGADP